jgi:hypothetical protein
MHACILQGSWAGSLSEEEIDEADEEDKEEESESKANNADETKATKAEISGQTTAAVVNGESPKAGNGLNSTADRVPEKQNPEIQVSGIPGLQILGYEEVDNVFSTRSLTPGSNVTTHGNLLYRNEAVRGEI